MYRNYGKEEIMLILKTFVNEKQIDEIHIHNRGNAEIEGNGYYNYKVVEPKGIKKIFLHKRDEGWKPLAISILKHLNFLEKKRKK
jgi:hypothetical protein